MYAVQPDGDIVMPYATYTLDPGGPRPGFLIAPPNYVPQSYGIALFHWNGSTYVLANTWAARTDPHNPSPVGKMYATANYVGYASGIGTWNATANFYPTTGSGGPQQFTSSGRFGLLQVNPTTDAVYYTDVSNYAPSTYSTVGVVPLNGSGGGQFAVNPSDPNYGQYDNVAEPSPPAGLDTLKAAQYGNVVYTLDTKFGDLAQSQLNADGSTTLQGAVNIGGVTANSSIAYNPNNGKLYVLEGDYNLLRVGTMNGFQNNFSIQTLALQGSPGGLAITPNYTYVSEAVSGSPNSVQVETFTNNFSADKFALPQLTSAGPVGTVTTAGGTFLYFADPAANAVVVYRQSPNSDALNYVQTVSNGVGGVSGLLGPGQMTVGTTANGTNVLYVMGNAQNSIAAFVIDPATGRLTFTGSVRQGVQGVRGLSGLSGLTLTSDHKYLVATGQASNTAVVFGVDPSPAS